jgi:hypothetical protein
MIISDTINNGKISDSIKINNEKVISLVKKEIKKIKDSDRYNLDIEFDIEYIGNEIYCVFAIKNIF